MFWQVFITVVIDMGVELFSFILLVNVHKSLEKINTYTVYNDE